jgi:hypothetical protein
MADSRTAVFMSSSVFCKPIDTLSVRYLAMRMCSRRRCGNPLVSDRSGQSRP